MIDLVKDDEMRSADSVELGIEFFFERVCRSRPRFGNSLACFGKSSLTRVRTTV